MSTSDNLFTVLQRECREHGTSLYKVCKELGIPYNTVRSWRDSTPMAITNLQAIKDKLNNLNPA